jgi:hypothetical protein
MQAILLALFSHLATRKAAIHEGRQPGSRAATGQIQGFQFANIYIAWTTVCIQHVIGGVLVSGAQVDANVRSLRLLFTDTRYLIDNYQREYAWSQDDVQILIDDLWEGFEGHNGRPAETFFLGPFVYVQHDPTSRWLVDGQQRFTTLHLILLHLHRIAQQYDEPDTAAKLYNLVYGYTRHGRPRRFRIDISERRPALEALRDGKKFTIIGKTLSVRNLWERGEQLRDLLEERIDSENCARFVDWMLDQVVMVAITAPDRPSGYRIFESMNDRGARLTPVDLLKSHLMSKVGDAEDEATELNNKWRMMLAELTAAGEDDPGTPRIFLKAALLAHWARSGTADARTIDTALHLWVKENPRLTGLDRHGGYFLFMDMLIKLANHYAMFLRAAHSVDHKNGAQAIYFNHVNGLNNQMSLLLAAVQPGDSVPEARSKASLAAKFLDLMFVTRALADEPTDARQFQDVINDAIPQLRRSQTVAEVSSILTQHLPDNDPFMDVPTFGMRGTNYRQVKYMLARLTAYVESGCKVDVGAEHYLGSPYPWQVEHVFANHPERYSAEIPRPGHLSLAASKAGRAAPAAVLGQRELQRRTIRREDRLLLTPQPAGRDLRSEESAAESQRAELRREERLGHPVPQLRGPPGDDDGRRKPGPAVSGAMPPGLVGRSGWPTGPQDEKGTGTARDGLIISSRCSGRRDYWPGEEGSRAEEDNGLRSHADLQTGAGQGAES